MTSDTESSCDSSDDELKPERRFGVPGFEIETHDHEMIFGFLLPGELDHA